MTIQLPSVRIISDQEQLRDSLQVLLISLSKISSVEVAGEVIPDSADKEQAPTGLVLLALDTSSTDLKTLQTLNDIKSTWPGARIVVLLGDVKQQRVVQTAGVDLILLQGINASRLLNYIDELLPKAD